MQLSPQQECFSSEVCLRGDLQYPPPHLPSELCLPPPSVSLAVTWGWTGHLQHRPVTPETSNVYGETGREVREGKGVMTQELNGGRVITSLHGHIRKGQPEGQRGSHQLGSTIAQTQPDRAPLRMWGRVHYHPCPRVWPCPHSHPSHLFHSTGPLPRP